MFGGGGFDGFPNNQGGGGYWGQWDAHYGPMHNHRPSRHQTALMAPAPYTAPRNSARATPLLPSPPPPAFLGPSPLDRNPAERNPSLYYDFNAPARPALITIRCAIKSVHCELQWNAPRTSKSLNFMYRLKVIGGAKGEKLFDFPSWKTNSGIDLEPGTEYTIVVDAVANGRILASGDLSFKSILCLAELATLQNRAINFLQGFPVVNQMQEICIFYRNKPSEYWRKIMDVDGIMRPYLKDANGQPGCPINHEINGLFFSARLHQGMLPTSSPFGGQRLKIFCQKLFLPETHNMYFSDFYCNTTVHYVTLVITLPNSFVDQFCSEKLIRLDPFNNMYMKMSVDNFGNYRYFVNNNIWVEMYYTADVPLWWGEFDFTVSMGQSKLDGVPNNKICKICNLYPTEPADSKENDPPSNKRKRSQSENDRDGDGSSNENDEPGGKVRKLYAEIPASLDADRNSEYSTLLLAMETVRRMVEEERNDRACARAFDEIKPYVVDVVRNLVDESVKIVQKDLADSGTPTSGNKVANESFDAQVREAAYNIRICTSYDSFDSGYSSTETSDTSFSTSGGRSSFLKELDDSLLSAGNASSTNVGETAAAAGGTCESESSGRTVDLKDVKRGAETFEALTKKLFADLSQLKNGFKNVEKRLMNIR